MAGVPKIMTSMLEDVAPRLRAGHRVLSRTLKLAYVGESWAADILRDIDHRYPDLSLGSYPFGMLPGEFGTHLVVRGQDQKSVDAGHERTDPRARAGRGRKPGAQSPG
ncbi:MAG: hypothetical protein WDN06_10025 [Asticcacaulis sp.]